MRALVNINSYNLTNSNGTFQLFKKFNFSRVEEWAKFYENKNKLNNDILNKELNEYQKKEVKVLVDRVVDLSKDEKKYYSILIKNKSKFITGEDPMKFDFTQPSELIRNQNTWPMENSNWLQTQHMESFLGSFSGGIGVVSKSSSENISEGTTSTGEKKGTENVKKEPVIEKTQFDVKLSSFDAGKKIALIKEIRSWLTLGLKEAKELVERAPVELKKGVKKEEAEEIKKKFAENGAVIELL